ncbi:MAG: tetratricopeptide repeat protein [Deltaproteobacteria bacterium]|nr:MAG: tetratricopeptide repeat protein [Deltaproteobacteria bacterium]
MNATHTRSALLRGPCLLLLLVLLAHGNTLRNGFVYDDHEVVEHEVLGEGDAPLRIGGRPMRLLTLRLDAWLWGRNPAGYHLTNLLLHLTASLLLLRLVQVLVGNLRVATVCALIFAVHPVQTEAVAVVSNRKEMLVALFVFLSLLAYHRGTMGRWWGYPIALVASLLAFLSKETAIVLPVILLLYHVTLCPVGVSRAIRRAAFFLVPLGLVVAFGIVRHLLHARVGYARLPDGETMRYAWFLYSIPRVVTHDLGKVLYPARLCADIPFDPDRTFWSLRVLLHASLATVPLGVVLPVFARVSRRIGLSDRRVQGIRFAVLWFYLWLLPVLNLIPGACFVAERYLYLPLAGFALLAALLFDLAFQGVTGEKHRERLLVGVLLLLLGGYTLRSHLRNREWASDEEIWFTTLRQNPHSRPAHVNLGNIAARKGNFKGALEHYEAAWKAGEESADLFFNMGHVYRLMGNTYMAQQAFLRVLRLAPDDVEARYMLGMMQAAQRNLPGAAATFRKLLERSPHHGGALRQLGRILRALGRPDEAIDPLERYLRLFPSDLQGYHDLALACIEAGDLPHARKTLQRARRLAPDDPQLKRLEERLAALSPSQREGAEK